MLTDGIEAFKLTQVEGGQEIGEVEAAAAIENDWMPMQVMQGVDRPAPYLYSPTDAIGLIEYSDIEDDDIPDDSSDDEMNVGANSLALVEVTGDDQVRDNEGAQGLEMQALLDDGEMRRADNNNA